MAEYSLGMRLEYGRIWPGNEVAVWQGTASLVPSSWREMVW